MRVAGWIALVVCVLVGAACKEVPLEGAAADLAAAPRDLAAPLDAAVADSAMPDLAAHRLDGGHHDGGVVCPDALQNTANQPCNGADHQYCLFGETSCDCCMDNKWHCGAFGPPGLFCQ